MSNKKTSKKEEEKQKEYEQIQEEEKRQTEREEKEGRLRELAQKSSPLLDYGLIDSYQYFLAQLAHSGIPQGNIYEFAAQSLLKYEKKEHRKAETLRQVELANHEAVKVVSESNQKSRPRAPREIKPQMLPFEISEQEKELLGRK